MSRQVRVGLFALVALSIWWSGMIPGTDRGERLRTAHAWTTLGAVITDVPDVSAVVLFDDGPFADLPMWAVIDDPARHMGTPVGLVFAQEDRADALKGRACVRAGALHGKHIWVVAGGTVVWAEAACDRDRMSLADLFEVANPAQIVPGAGPLRLSVALPGQGRMVQVIENVNLP